MFAKQSMINRLSNAINRNRSAAKISKDMSSDLNGCIYVQGVRRWFRRWWNSWLWRRKSEQHFTDDDVFTFRFGVGPPPLTHIWASNVEVVNLTPDCCLSFPRFVLKTGKSPNPASRASRQWTSAQGKTSQRVSLKMGMEMEMDAQKQHFWPLEKG